MEYAILALSLISAALTVALFIALSKYRRALRIIERMPKFFQTLNRATDEQTDDIIDEVRALRGDMAQQSHLTIQTLEQRIGSFAEQQTRQNEQSEARLRETLAATEQRQAQLERTVAASLERIRSDNEQRLEQMRQTVDERLTSTLSKRLDASFEQVGAQLKQVYTGLGEMQRLAGDLGDFKRVLTNVKARGTWAEVQLGALLEQVLAPNQYEKNACVVPGSLERVEYAIVLPGDDSGPVKLPIDSKFPQEDYLRIVEAGERADAAQIEAATNALKRRLLSEAQKIDGLDENETSKRYMHHYNFPSYSVGETKPSRGPGRREIGHGALAERALVPVLPTAEEFPYAIRTVSETMESNGSTSQASICASTLSLMAAGVPIKAPVAGISCGLVTGDTDDDYIVLTDIQGLEDFFGDMDFKVGGTHKGITSIQMDIKIHGLTRPIIEEAIAKTREARLYILDEVMAPVISEPRKTVSQYAPKIVQISIDPQKIGDVVGKQGKVINKIIEQTGVKIDIEDDGSVAVCGTDQAMIDKAVSIIKGIVTDIEPGQILTGTVVRIMNFGAFVELAPNKDGMVHISKLSDKRVAKVEDVVNIGDEVTVKVIEVDKMGRINLSMKPGDLAENK